MNKLKQIDIIRKRNAELTEELENMRFKLEFDSQLNTESYKYAKDLICDLEKIKSEWLEIIEDLNEKSVEYSYLISELKAVRDVVRSMGFKIPMHKKILLYFQNKK